MSKFLIVGLGNVGQEYADTRHNIGFDVVNAFVSKHGGGFVQERLAFKAEVKYKGRLFICVCPTTYMNLSGRAFKYWLDKEQVPIEQTLTIVDDLSLPLDKIRIRGAGTHAGHNGLRDIENILGTDAYPKLRFGIGNAFPKGMQADFVLGKWKKEELPLVRIKISASVEIIESFAMEGLSNTMTRYNNMVFKENQ
jgi:PTH1 family peptidyl-tRNA hydrolase